MEIAKQIVSLNKRLIIGLLGIAIAFALTVGGTQGASANQPYVITNEQVDVSGINYKGTILEDVKMHNGTNQQNCKWVDGGYNSGRGVNGELYWFYDPVKAKICKNPNSPTGWVKVDGGQTGRNCGNPYKPEGQAPGPVVKGPVTMVRDFSKINMNAAAKAEVSLKADIVCPGGSTLSAQSTGVATSSIKINQQMLLSAQGNMDKLEAQLKNDVKAKATAQAQGKIEANCGSVTTVSQPTPPQPPAPQPNPAPPAPKDLPNTGPGAIAAAFVGVSSLASYAHHVISRRLHR